MTGWFRHKDSFSDVPGEGLVSKLAPGLIPDPLYALQYTTFSTRTRDGAGWLLRGTVTHESGSFEYETRRGGGSHAAVPVRVRLDHAGLPVEFTVDFSASTDPTKYFTARLSYDDVEPIPTIRDAKPYNNEGLNPCVNYQ